MQDFNIEISRAGDRIARGVLSVANKDDAFLIERLINASGEIRAHIDLVYSHQPINVDPEVSDEEKGAYMDVTERPDRFEPT